MVNTFLSFVIFISFSTYFFPLKYSNFTILFNSILSSSNKWLFVNKQYLIGLLSFSISQKNPVPLPACIALFINFSHLILHIDSSNLNKFNISSLVTGSPCSSKIHSFFILYSFNKIISSILLLIFSSCITIRYILSFSSIISYIFSSSFSLSKYSYIWNLFSASLGMISFIIGSKFAKYVLIFWPNLRILVILYLFQILGILYFRFKI